MAGRPYPLAAPPYPIPATLQTRIGISAHSAPPVAPGAPRSGGLDPYLRPVEHVEMFGAARGLSRPDARRDGERLARHLAWELAGAPVAGRLSGGTAQKLRMVLALVGSPRLVLADEPYKGLDTDSTRRFWDLLWPVCEDGAGAVVSSHDPEVLRRADTVVELQPAGRQPRGA